MGSRVCSTHSHALGGLNNKTVPDLKIIIILAVSTVIPCSCRGHNSKGGLVRKTIKLLTILDESMLRDKAFMLIDAKRYERFMARSFKQAGAR